MCLRLQSLSISSTANQLSSPTANTVQAGQPSGTSTLNLRNLGTQRTLVLQNGRRQMEHRLAVVCGDTDEGAARLRAAAARPAPPPPRTDRPVAFLFPGEGAHYEDMARGRYDAAPAERRPAGAIRPASAH